MQTLEVTEYAANPGRLRVNRETGVFYNVKVLGTKSENGRLYPLAAIRAAAPKFEGVKVNIGHQLTGERSYVDRFGTLRNVQVSESGLHADLHANPKHALFEQLAWDAENAPGNVGLSHHAKVKARLENGVHVVESITSVASVDLVANPATTHGLFESADAPRELTFVESIQARKDSVTAFAARYGRALDPKKTAERYRNAR